MRYISLDLLDQSSIAATMDAAADATHLFYAAFQAAPGAASGYAADVGPNLQMLVNSVAETEERSPALERVVLMTGTKTYDVHLGPHKNAARENDPRHMPPNYCFDQVDSLVERQKGKGWDWTELRPQTLCGFALGTPMSIALVIGVYAAFCLELGLPLRFPGPVTVYNQSIE